MINEIELLKNDIYERQQEQQQGQYGNGRLMDRGHDQPGGEQSGGSNPKGQKGSTLQAEFGDQATSAEERFGEINSNHQPMKKKRKIPSGKVKKQKGKSKLYIVRLTPPPSTTTDSEPYNGVVRPVSNCLIRCN